MNEDSGAVVAVPIGTTSAVIVGVTVSSGGGSTVATTGAGSSGSVGEGMGKGVSDVMGGAYGVSVGAGVNVAVSDGVGEGVSVKVISGCISVEGGVTSCAETTTDMRKNSAIAISDSTPAGQNQRWVDISLVSAESSDTLSLPDALLMMQ